MSMFTLLNQQNIEGDRIAIFHTPPSPAPTQGDRALLHLYERVWEPQEHL
jgi:hypothetical protein